MRKLLLSTILTAGLTFVGINSYGETEQPTNEVREQNTEESVGLIDSYVRGLKEVTLRIIDIDDDILKLQDGKGRIHSFKVVDQRMLKEVEVGDVVKVKIEKRED